MLKLILLASTVVLITTTAGAQHVITVPPDGPKTPTTVEDRSQEVHIKRSGTTERIDMYPGMIWRYEAKQAIKHVYVGDEDLVFVKPGETDRVLYIGAFNKTGGNVGGNTNDKAGGTTVIVNNGNNNPGDNNGDKTGGKTGGITNVILQGVDHEPIANILIVALPSYLRADEGLVRILRDGRYWTTYQCGVSHGVSHCREVPTSLPQPK
jgi:hypothetical protein